jgi:predicted Fe-S protein YdhL (DUF1289 family)
VSDDIWKRDEIESPCAKICVLHVESGLCTGCYRSREEIAAWSRLTPEERRHIMDELPDRKPLVMRRRGGRRRRVEARP